MAKFTKEKGYELRGWATGANEVAARAAIENDPKSLLTGLATSLLYTVSGIFEGGGKETAKQSEAEDSFDQAILTWKNDRCLFEVWCYAFFHLDLWLHRKGHGKFRSYYNNFVVDFSLSVFQKLLGATDLTQVFNNRLDLYGQATREDKSDERFRFLFEQSVLSSDTANEPTVLTFPGSPVIIGNFFETFSLHAHVAAWFKAMLPVHTEGLEWVIKCFGKLGLLSANGSNDPIEAGVSHMSECLHCGAVVQAFDHDLEGDDLCPSCGWSVKAAAKLHPERANRPKGNTSRKFPKDFRTNKEDISLRSKWLAHCVYRTCSYSYHSMSALMHDDRHAATDTAIFGEVVGYTMAFVFERLRHEMDENKQSPDEEVANLFKHYVLTFAEIFNDLIGYNLKGSGLFESIFMDYNSPDYDSAYRSLHGIPPEETTVRNQEWRRYHNPHCC